MKFLSTSILCSLLFLVSCNPEIKEGQENQYSKEEVGDFPDVQNISNLKTTNFVPTFESEFVQGNNIIYAATLPMAWNEIKHSLTAPPKDFSSEQLKELNGTLSFKNVLKKSEYKTEVEIDGTRITARAHFKKSLPFEEPLRKYENPFQFGKKNVESFGFWGDCEFARINYYNSSTDFSISLLPKNKEHEIILLMLQGKNDHTSFQEYYKRYQSGTNKPHEEKDAWRYSLGHRDKLQLPIIEFNLKKNFSKSRAVPSYHQVNNF